MENKFDEISEVFMKALLEQGLEKQNSVLRGISEIVKRNRMERMEALSAELKELDESMQIFKLND